MFYFVRFGEELHLRFLIFFIVHFNNKYLDFYELLGFNKMNLSL